MLDYRINGGSPDINIFASCGELLMIAHDTYDLKLMESPLLIVNDSPSRRVSTVPDMPYRILSPLISSSSLASCMSAPELRSTINDSRALFCNFDARSVSLTP